MNAISSYRGNRPTNKQIHSQDWLQYTVTLSLAHSVMNSMKAELWISTA